MRSHALVLLAVAFGGCGGGAARSEPAAYFGTGGGNYHLVLDGDRGTLTHYGYERRHLYSGQCTFSVVPLADLDLGLVDESGTTRHVVRFVGADELLLFCGPTADAADLPIHLHRTASLDSGSTSFKALIDRMNAKVEVIPAGK